MRVQLLSLLIALIFLKDHVSCECIQSFVTVCDTFQDFKDVKDKESLTEVMIGSPNGTPNMTSVDLMKTLWFNQYPRLTTLMVIRAVNKLFIEQYAFQCTYYGRELQSVIFYGNIMKTIQAYNFPLFGVKKLSLVNNQIEELKGWAFKNIDVENLDLSDNLLEVIDSENLPLTEANKIVTIKNNRLTHIEPGSFSPSLESLNLDNNKFRHIQDGVIDNLTNLKELTLSHNNFNVFPKIDRLKNLVIFDISFNKITDVRKGMFQNMKNLKLVDLSNNQIANLQIDSILTPGRQPDLTISLALNRLRSMSLDNFPLDNKTFVLYGNPWDCGFWPVLKKKIEGHESKCDSKFFSDGSVPYCINYLAGSYPFVAQWEQDVDRFQETVRRSENKAGCELAPKRYVWLYPVDIGCVA